MAITESDIQNLVDPRRNPKLRALMMEVGEDIAEKAQRAAPRRERPRRNSHGADYIRAEFGQMRTRELVVKVSWDKPHFYMSFQEFGTRYLTPRAFLLGAIAGYRYRRYGK